VIREYAATERTARRLTEQLRACEAAALAFCRLLEKWHRGEAIPATAGGREAALRHAADRIETALAGIPGLEYTRSLSRNGFSQVTAVFADSVDIYFARQQVNERLGEAGDALPQ